jgi:hypothetical protein
VTVDNNPALKWCDKPSAPSLLPKTVRMQRKHLVLGGAGEEGGVSAAPAQRMAVRHSTTMIKVLFDTNILIDYLRGYAQAAAEIERTKRINLPDALIWATAQVNDRLLISRNTKDFSADEPGVRVPYELR